MNSQLFHNLNDIFSKYFENYSLDEKLLSGVYKCPNESCNTNRKGNHSYGKFKLTITYSKNACHCWVCDSSWNLLSIAKEFFSNEDKSNVSKLLKGKNFKSYSLHNSQKYFSQVDNYHLSQFKNIVGNSDEFDKSRFIGYLYKRGITNELIEYYSIQYCNNADKYNDCIIVPSFNKDDKINYFVARSINDNARQKYINPSFKSYNIIFNEHLIDFSRNLILVEGVFDYLKLHGMNRVCLLGSNLNKHSLLFQTILKNNTPIYIFLDKDAQKKAIKFQKLFNKYGIKSEIIDNKIFEELHIEDAGNISLLNENHKTKLNEYLNKNKVIVKKNSFEMLKERFRKIKNI